LIPCCIYLFVGRLSTTAEAIEKGINALAEVLLECAKKNLSVADFELSVADLRFNDEAKTFLGEVLHNTTLHCIAFKDTNDEMLINSSMVPM
jgi:hypothetical protein